MKVGFTGTQRGMTRSQKDKVSYMLERFISGTNQLHEGDCIGADEQAASIAKALGYQIVSWPPVNDSKRAFFQADFQHCAMEYLERNRKIVLVTEMLIATPGEREEVLRSGTWSTIRHAIKTGKPVVIITP